MKSPMPVPRYVRHMDTGEAAIVTRMVTCKMISHMMARKSDFFFLSDIKFRNRLLELVTDWMMWPGGGGEVCRGLDESVIEAVAILLRKLPLHPDEVHFSV